MHLNLFRDGGALIEAEPAGDQSIPLDDLLDDAAVRCLTAAIEGLSSYELSRAAAALFLAGARLAQRDARRTLTSA